MVSILSDADVQGHSDFIIYLSRNRTIESTHDKHSLILSRNFSDFWLKESFPRSLHGLPNLSSSENFIGPFSQNLIFKVWASLY